MDLDATQGKHQPSSNMARSRNLSRSSVFTLAAIDPQPMQPSNVAAQPSPTTTTTAHQYDVNQPAETTKQAPTHLESTSRPVHQPNTCFERPPVKTYPTLNANFSLEASMTGPFRLLDLPLEIRQMVYGYAFEDSRICYAKMQIQSSKWLLEGEFVSLTVSDHRNLLSTAKQLRVEAIPLYYETSRLQLDGSWWSQDFKTCLPESLMKCCAHLKLTGASLFDLETVAREFPKMKAVECSKSLLRLYSLDWRMSLSAVFWTTWDEGVVDDFVINNGDALFHDLGFPVHAEFEILANDQFSHAIRKLSFTVNLTDREIVSCTPAIDVHAPLSTLNLPEEF